MPSPEVPPQESAPKQPIRTLLVSEVRIGDAEQMARIIRGEARFYYEDSDDIPYLEHPLGIKIRFGEGFVTVRNPNPVTTISVEEAFTIPPSGFTVESQIGNIVFTDAHVKMFDDAVVISQSGTIGGTGEEADVVDEITITREGYRFERKRFPF